MSADDLEASLRKLRGERHAASQTDAQRRAQIFADGARYAAAFIELMRRHRVQPEPIYTFRQLNARDPHQQTIDVFRHFENAWVIDFSYNPYEHGLGSTVQCLRPDGKMFHCFTREISPKGFPTRGLVANPPKIALARVPGTWVLNLTEYDNGTIFQYELKDPQYRQDTYVKAADWYL